MFCYVISFLCHLINIFYHFIITIGNVKTQPTGTADPNPGVLKSPHAPIDSVNNLSTAAAQSGLSPSSTSSDSIAEQNAGAFTSMEKTRPSDSITFEVGDRVSKFPNAAEIGTVRSFHLDPEGSSALVEFDSKQLGRQGILVKLLRLAPDQRKNNTQPAAAVTAPPVAAVTASPVAAVTASPKRKSDRPSKRPDRFSPHASTPPASDSAPAGPPPSKRQRKTSLAPAASPSSTQQGKTRKKKQKKGEKRSSKLQRRNKSKSAMKVSSARCALFSHYSGPSLLLLFSTHCPGYTDI